jgi:hypothetical protein
MLGQESKIICRPTGKKRFLRQRALAVVRHSEELSGQLFIGTNITRLGARPPSPVRRRSDAAFDR